MAIKQTPDPDVLERLYHEEGLSTYEIADRIDVDQATVYGTMKREGIETRPAPKDKPPGYYTKENGCCYWQCQRHSVNVHRLVMVAEYGLKALDGMVVHHKNNLKWDNRPENLELMKPEEHGKLHREEQLDEKYGRNDMVCYGDTQVCYSPEKDCVMVNVDESIKIYVESDNRTKVYYNGERCLSPS